jgi:Skp family chaperone for outer membrane proteins
MKRSLLALALSALASAWFLPQAAAQKQDYFVPHRPAPAPARPAPRPAPPPQAPAMSPPAQEEQQQVQAPMPPVPELPALPRGPTPPAAVIGVIGVPDVMRASTAAQQVDKVIGERREKLNADAQKEQQQWRELQQKLVNDRSKLSPEQVRTRERELQERITKAQRDFQGRGRIIQEATQYGLNQIQASLIAVIRQVAESRGMNLVMHRQQVALNVNEFDITDQVTEALNKLLPSVVIPPDGVSPNAAPPAAQAPAPAAPKPAATAPKP